VPDKRLCYFTAQSVTAYLWKRGALTKEAAFPMNQAGVEDFSKYVAGAPQSLFYVLADVVEEDFFQENIPSVHGADRRALLRRKLAQRYRDTSLAMPIPIGSEIHAGRREERILYTSFTNTHQFQPWLDVLRSKDARLVGVFSVALVAASLGKRLRFKKSRYIMVSLQQAGLRQSYIENGRIRFSRLGRVDLTDPRAVAKNCAVESSRLHQYLVNARILPREIAPFDVIVLAPSEHKAHYDAACVSSARLQFQVFDLGKTATSLGLKSAPADAFAEGLFLHALAQSPPGEQYADDGVRHFYHLWRTRVGLITAGAAAFGACFLFSAVRLFEASQVDEMARNDRLQEARASEEYSRLQTRFPKTPTSSENLKTIVTNYRALVRQTASPAGMLTEISEALTPVPQIEIEKINWEVGAPLKSTERGASKAPPTPRGAAGQARPSDSELPVQSAEISGKLIVQQASDYRAVGALVERFTDALRQKPGTEVIRSNLPFDINAEKSLSGDIGAARGVEVPRFSVTVTKRMVR